MWREPMRRRKDEREGKTHGHVLYAKKGQLVGGSLRGKKSQDKLCCM